ncbi:MAG TPA: K(+)-transporting ATPase subunit F [Steroidobacteraceae bacterium]|nr:K(+)-transporting ATPase subunit F [Steroidobacteraceae bacterium]
MTVLEWAALAIGAGLGVYLCLALLWPEKFQ